MKTGKNVGRHGTASQIRLSLTVNCRAMRVLRREIMFARWADGRVRPWLDLQAAGAGTRPPTSI